MIRRPPRSTLFPTRRSSDLHPCSRHADPVSPPGWLPTGYGPRDSQHGFIHLGWRRWAVLELLRAGHGVRDGLREGREEEVISAQRFGVATRVHTGSVSPR